MLGKNYAVGCAPIGLPVNDRRLELLGRSIHALAQSVAAMRFTTVDIQSTQTDLAGLVALVAAGTEVILTRGETPVARVVPVQAGSRPRIAGLHAGAIETTDDFDEPLPDDFWTGAS
jgi:antitoxin (DNA-binding transcriptional repressor) of toxin-antitoxin stability system